MDIQIGYDLFAIRRIHMWNLQHLYHLCKYDNNYVSRKNDHYEILHEDVAQLSQKESFSRNGRFVDTIVPPRVRRVATDARSKIPVESQALG